MGGCQDEVFDTIDYPTYGGIFDTIDELAKAYPNVTKTITIGETHEGREIPGICLGNNLGASENLVVCVIGGFHAREWIGPASIMHVIRRILESQDFLGVEWHFIPCVNADGYVYSRGEDDDDDDNRSDPDRSNWRRTRREQVLPSGAKIVGADPNRNWGHHWNEGPFKRETYGGTEPWSEPCVSNLRNYLQKVNDTRNFHAFVDIHSCISMVLWPWAFSKVPTPDSMEMGRVGKEIVSCMSSAHGHKFTGGQTSQMLYEATGNAMDWSYSTLGVKYSYCFELRGEPGTREYSFQPSDDNIQPSSDELYAGLQALVETTTGESAKIRAERSLEASLEIWQPDGEKLFILIWMLALLTAILLLLLVQKLVRVYALVEGATENVQLKIST